MNTSWTRWPAPAKLNLFLHIVGRRADGYHLLQTVFQLLDWGDIVQLRLRDDGNIVRQDAIAGVSEAQDLGLRAAIALKAHTGSSLGAEIRIDKKIPIGAGLGGGSSDAASVLVGLNELWDTGCSPEELARIGLSLGADVPVFVIGQSAWAEGIGERLTPLVLPPRYFVIVDPGVSIATGSLFQAPELTRNSPPTTITDYLEEFGAGTTNVFAPIARARYPQLAAAMDWLGRFGEVRLSGSGSAIFAAVDSEARAREITGRCPPEFRARVARGLNRSLLLDARDQFRVARA